jgi:predicted metal-dependent phosphoesterase TrpH
VKFDMHVHTFRSERDGWMRPERLIKCAIEKDLDGLAVTDHNTIQGAVEIFDLVRDEQMDLVIIIGEEITTDYGEVLAYFIKNEIEPGSFEEVLAEIRLAGGVSALPHPFDRIRKGFRGVETVLDEVDAIEALNSRCLFNKRALDLCLDRGKPMLGGSDAHFYQEVGRAWTEFLDDAKSCILDGKTRVGGGLTNPAYLAMTKGVKIWRKLISGLD